MAHVYVTVAGADRSVYDEVLRRAALDRFGVHRLAPDPDRADLILFAEYADEPFQQSVRHHPLVRRHRERCFVLDERDHTFPFLPGVYASVPRAWSHPDRTRSGGYRVMFQHGIQIDPVLGAAPGLLFSFVGAFWTAAVRRRLGALDHPRGWVCDTSSGGGSRGAYLQAITSSAFVLCPRGLAPATTRLFDVMRAGRVPVVLADDWVPPEGPDWDAFALRVPEAEAARLPATLEALEGTARQRGAAARAAWEAWFAPDVSFHRAVEGCLDIQSCRRVPERVLRWRALWQLAHQPYRYNFYRYARAALRAGRPI